MWTSLESASFWNSVANLGLIVGLVIGLISTLVIVFTGKVIQRESNERIAIAERQAAEANRKAEEERLARVKIEEKLAPRFLTEEQYNNLRDKLVVFAGTTIEVIAYPTGTPDVIPLSYQIVSMFNDAKWKAIFLKSTGSTLFLKGVIVAIKNESDHNILTAAKLLVEELNSYGVDTVFKNSFPEDKGMFFSSISSPDDLNEIEKILNIRILIGTKP